MNTIVYVGTSLDGFIARTDGEFDWLSQFANDEAIRAYAELINRIDAIVIGRGTFEKVLTFPSWPYEKRVFVLSASITEAPENIREKVTILSMDPGALLSMCCSVILWKRSWSKSCDRSCSACRPVIFMISGISWRSMAWKLSTTTPSSVRNALTRA
jgi:hypothetical protein